MELVEKEVNEILNDELGCPSYEMATIDSLNDYTTVRTTKIKIQND